MEPKISIIIPCYNMKNYINECINSCLSQTYSNIEIVIVDDGSTDGSWDEIQRITNLSNSIKAFRLEKNRGACYARNYGLSKSIGKYLLFLDSDDYLYDGNVIKSLVEKFPHDIDFVFGDRIEMEQSTGQRILRSQRSVYSDDLILDIVRQCPITSTVLFEKRFFQYVTWFESDTNCQEYHLMVLGVIRGLKYSYIPSVIAVIRFHDSPYRINNMSTGKHSYIRKNAELLIEFETDLRDKKKWDRKKQIYFNYKFFILSLLSFYKSQSREEDQFAESLWRSVDRTILFKADDFRFFSWAGVAYVTSPWIVSMLWRFKDWLWRPRIKSAEL